MTCTPVAAAVPEFVNLMRYSTVEPSATVEPDVGTEDFVAVNFGLPDGVLGGLLDGVLDDVLDEEPGGDDEPGGAGGKFTVNGSQGLGPPNM